MRLRTDAVKLHIGTFTAQLITEALLALLPLPLALHQSSSSPYAQCLRTGPLSVCSPASLEAERGALPRRRHCCLVTTKSTSGYQSTIRLVDPVTSRLLIKPRGKAFPSPVTLTSPTVSPGALSDRQLLWWLVEPAAMGDHRDSTDESLNRENPSFDKITSHAVASHSKIQDHHHKWWDRTSNQPTSNQT